MKGFTIAYICFIGGVLSQPHPAVDSILRRVNDGVEPFPAHRHGARRGGVDPIDRRGSIMGGIDGRGSIVGGIDGSGRFTSGSDPLHRHGGIVGGRIDRMSGVGGLDRRFGGVRSQDRRGAIIGGIERRGRFNGGVDRLDRHGGIVGGLSGISGIDRRLGGVDSLGRRGRFTGGMDGSGRFIGGGMDRLGVRGSLLGGRRARTWIGGQSLGTTLGGLGQGTALGGLSTSATSGRICYTRGERPAYDRSGQVEWCSTQYNFCNAPGAVCRLTGWGPRRVGACCHRTGGQGPERRVKIIFGPDSGGPMFEPQQSRPRPKGEEGIWNVFVTKGDCGPYKPLDGFNIAAIRNKITEFYSVRKQLLFRLCGISARIDKRLEQINKTCPNRK